ncbi:MAG: hypothetical protein ACKO24_18765 [Leptolyngbyaceae cyanobacterium]
MNQKLQRIEAALHQIQDYPQFQSVSIPTQLTTPPIDVDGSDRSVTLPQFPLIQESTRGATTEASLPLSGSKQPLPGLESLLRVAPDPSNKLLHLPRVGTPGFTSHHNAANPALALNLLKELQTLVGNWQQELAQVLLKIQAVYLEGPILDGWLESYTCQEGKAPEFRHADVDCLMTYVEKLTETPAADADQASSQESLSAGYRLCGINEEGQIWFRHCPAEQVAAVSLAILRYQRLKTLLSQKDALQTRLSRLAESLIGLHSEARVPLEQE